VAGVDIPHTYTALVVDDEEGVRILLQRVLKHAGILTETAGDGVAASRALEQKRFDVLVCDLRMPNKHGHQLISEVLDTPFPPLIFVITGIPEPRLALDLFQRGVQGIDYKPLHYEAFAAKVRGMLLHRERLAKSPHPGAPGSSPVDQASQAVRALHGELASTTAALEKAVQKLKEQQATLEEGFLGSLRMLTGLVSQISNATSIHASRVERMAAYIGEQAGLDVEALRSLKMAALLHEIGQFSMPDSIRREAPWNLAADLWAHYKMYPTIGATLLSEIRGTEDIVQLVEAHAENYDGSGFPRKLVGDDIPLGARILRIADAYDTYRMFLDNTEESDEARQRLAEDHRKGLLDPALFKHALTYIATLQAEQDGRQTCQLLVDQLQPGMELAERVYDDDGRYLARQGAILTPPLIEHLRRLVRGKGIQVIVSERNTS
jgi:response regulator RpfG family c-di-GMP phosphodiesterase